jgi:hypothetical protein
MRLILHAGTHKTGTSTIQRVLFDERKKLRRVGIYYPDPRPFFGRNEVAHHAFVHALARPDASQDAVTAFMSEMRRSTKADETVVLSAEPVYRHVLPQANGDYWAGRRAYLRTLREALHPFTVHALLLFRRRDRFIESVYHERVSKGLRASFPEMTKKSHQILDYAKQLEAFRSVFPAVQIASYEELSRSGLVAGFLDLLGYAVDLRATSWERRSTDARITLWMAEQNRRDPDADRVAARRDFSHSRAARELFADFGQVTLWQDLGARRALLDAYDDLEPIDDVRPPAVLTAVDNERICAAFQDYEIATSWRAWP